MLSLADSELVARDPDLPGLATLLDADRMMALIEAYLGVGSSSLRMTYLRYKPHTSCVAGYTLLCGDTERHFYARGHRLDAWGKLDKLRLPSDFPAHSETVPSAFDELAIVVSQFPNDRKLKSVGRLLDGESRRQFLKRLFPKQPDDWSADVRTLRYKPERRYVAVLVRGDKPVAVLKFYSDVGFPHAQRSAKAFETAAADLVPRRLGRSRRHRVLGFEWLNGRLLSDAIVACDELTEALPRVGRTLANLHALRSKRLAKLPQQLLEQTVAAPAEFTAFVCPELAERVRRLARYLIDAASVRVSDLCPIHGDFYADQVLIASDAVKFLDFDQAVRGDPAADVGNFLARLNRDVITGQLASTQFARLREAFLSGYRLGSPEALPDDRIDLYTAIALVKITPHAFRSRVPNWPDATRAIIERAEQLGGLHPTPAAAVDRSGLHRALEQCASEPAAIGAGTTVVTDAASVGAEAGSIRHEETDAGTAPRHGFVRAKTVIDDPYGVNHDERMPFLDRAIDAATMARLLAANVDFLADVRASFSLTAIRVVRYKPGRRCLIEYDIQQGPHDDVDAPLTLIGKARAKGMDWTTFELTQKLWRSGFDDRSADGISVPEPVGAIPDLHMWLQRKVPGEPATRLLGGTDAFLLARRAAEAIHKFHQSQIPTSRQHTLHDELAVLRDRLSKVSRERPDLSARIIRILDACGRLARSIPDAKPCRIHRDFYPDQLVVDGSRLFLVDVDLSCHGDPALDVGNFCGHLVEHSLRHCGRPDALQDCAVNLIDRFLELNRLTQPSAITAYTTLTLARHIFISTQFAERTHVTEPVLSLCETRLADV